MLQFRFPKLLALGALTLGFFSTAFAQEFTPKRVGPVSQYGQLQAGKNAQNEGRIYGSCAAYSTSGNEVQVKGMSLFWSNEKSQNRFWRNDVITGMVSQQGIQVIRAAMAVDDQGWGNGHYFINGKTEYYQDLLDETVQAAIEQDIYVIIDYHSHTAVDNVGRAKEFFKIQAKKWGSYPNVIFEIYNEPICKAGQGHGNSSNCTMITWPEIKAYANEVIPIIRRYSDNLIVVGTPSWSGNPGAVVGNAITGYDNIAYTFHYYAGKNDGTDAHDFNSMSADVNSALGAGLSVFVTEWGTVGYGGDGAPSMANNPQWQTWMNLKKLSSANWNAGRNMTKDGAENSEYFADFDVDNTSPANWTYSASGEWVNANVFNGLSAMTYSQCASYVDLPAVPADDPDFDDSGDDFGDNIYEDEVISHDYVIDDFDGNNSANEYHYYYESGKEGDWTNGNNGESTFFVDGSNVGGVVGVVTGNNGWAGYGVHVESLKGCETFSYRFRGLAHGFTLGDKVAQSVTESGDWVKMTFDLTDIDPADLDAPFTIQWQVTGSSSGDSLLIDDVQCGEPASGSNDSPVPPYMIDDFDGDQVEGYIYVATYGNGAYGNELLEPGVFNVFFPGEGGGAAAGVVGASASNVPKEDLYSGVSLEKEVPGLAGCSWISYRYKGPGHKFRVKMPSVMDGNFHSVMVQDEAPDWETALIDASRLEQEDWGTPKELDMSKINAISWEMNEVSGANFFVDNVQCLAEKPAEDPIEPYEYVVSDFDGNGTALYSYVFNYGASSFTNAWDASCDDGNGCNVVVLQDAAYTGDYGAALVGISSTKPTSNDPGEGAAVLNVRVPNLEGCKTLKYAYKGAGHTVMLRYNENDDYTYEVDEAMARTEWGVKMVPIAGYGSPEEITDIRFRVLGRPDSGYLYVDDVECVLEEPAVELPEPKAPTTYTALVDDFEDGDNYPLWPVGNWWIDYAGPKTGTSMTTVKGSQSSKALQVKFTLDGSNIDYDPYAAISSNNFDDLNLSNCTEVRYDYKGAAHKFRIKFSRQINDRLNLDWNFHAFAVESRSESWQTVSIPLSSLRQQYCDENECYWGSYIPLDTIMKRVDGFDWRVDGADGLVDSLAIDNIRCVGLGETPYYTVTFKNGDGSTMETQTWAENSYLYFPDLAPTKEPTAQYEFFFTGWNPSLVDEHYEPVRVTADTVYTPVFTEELRYYEITFLKDNDEMIMSDTYAYGTRVASFSPSAPAKVADDSCTYAFAGWDPSFDSETIVEGAVTYKATYEPTMKSFDITFKNKDGGVIEVVSEVYGTLADEINAPTAPGVQGKKFAGWTPGLTRVTGAAVYTATYTDKFVITWKDYNGNVLWTDFLDEGETPDYGAAPARAATAEYTYTFKGWSPAVAEVTDDAIYTATYDSTKNKYDVVFYDEDGTTSLVALTAGPYEYGTLVSSIAPTPTKAATAQYSYTFAGWNPAVTIATAVTDDVSYTAVYTETVNTYTITFVLDDGTTEYATVTRDYGTEISTMLPKVDPVKAADAQYTYEFVKWVAEDGSDVDMDAWLGSDMTLKAKFSQFVRKYTVTFLNYNSDVLKAATLYEYGADVVIPDDPTRDPAGVYTYEFSGWSPLVTQVTQEQVYTATYDSTAHYGAIAVSVIDGKKTATIDGSYTDGDVVNIPNSIEIDTVVFNRTFSASGYSTITLPFSINRSAIEGVSKVLTFTGIGYDENGKKQVEMEEVTGELSAYKPYMVELTSEGGLVFHGNSMVIQPTEGANTVVQGDDGWEFRGTLSKIVWDEKHPDLGRVYGFSAKEANNVRIGQFVKAGKGAWINPFRAYMIYNEGNSAGKSAGHAYVSAEPLPDYMDVVVVSRGATGEESKTVIGGINTRTGEFKMMQDYDLKGRKLNGKPTARGVYYGKRKIVK